MYLCVCSHVYYIFLYFLLSLENDIYVCIYIPIYTHTHKSISLSIYYCAKQRLYCDKKGKVNSQAGERSNTEAKPYMLGGTVFLYLLNCSMFLSLGKLNLSFYIISYQNSQLDLLCRKAKIFSCNFLDPQYVNKRQK